MKNLLLIFLVLLSMTSCRSKKKLVERERTKTELSEVVKLDSVVKKDTSIDSSAVKKSETITVSKDAEIEISGNDTDTITVNESITPTGRKITVTGAKKVVIRDKQQSTRIKDSAAVDVKKTDRSEIVRSETREKEESAESNSRKTDTKTKGTNTFVSIAIGVGIVGGILALIIIWYIRRKRRMLSG